MEKETLHYRTILRPFHFKTCGNIMVILQNPVHQNWSISRILSKKSLSVCFWQTMDLNMLYMHASTCEFTIHMRIHICWSMCFCTICIALHCIECPFSQIISSFWSDNLLMMFVHPSVCCVWKQTDVEIALKRILSFKVLAHSGFPSFLYLIHFWLQNSQTLQSWKFFPLRLKIV